MLPTILSAALLLAPATTTAAKPAPTRATPGTPVPKANGVAGVWMAVIGDVPTIMAGATAGDPRWVTFWDDGVYYDDLPKEGFLAFDRDAASKDTHLASHFGTWKSSKGGGTAQQNGVTSPWKLELTKPDELAYRNRVYYRLASLDDLKLDGAWTSYANPADPSLRTPGDHPVLRFTPDGHFRDEGLWKLFMGFGEPDAQKAPGAGTYEIRDFTLTLHYDDGRSRTAALSLLLKETPKASPDSIYVGRTRLNRMR